VEVAPAATLAVGPGSTVTFQAVARNGAGEPVSVSVAWRSDDLSVATVDASGMATAVAAGTSRIVAEAEGVQGFAVLEVWVPQDVSVYAPGTSYEGRRGYIEYVPGELPVVISAPHGGDLTPEEIPDRTWGTVVTDTNTRETLLAVREAFIEHSGGAPHVVISHLRRTKLDPNRELEEAAQGSPFAENAWMEFHGFIEIAETSVAEEFGAGLYLDLHGHGHPNAWVELGYLLSPSDLSQPDEVLDGPAFVAKSSIRALAERVTLPFSELLRGSRSFGGMLEGAGLRAVPSPGDPDAGGEAYFSGGYNTGRHGSRTPGRTIDGIQLELPRPGIRDTDGNRRLFATRLVQVVDAYLTEHSGVLLHASR
jgi:hypothetical protein